MRFANQTTLLCRYLSYCSLAALLFGGSANCVQAASGSAKTNPLPHIKFSDAPIAREGRNFVSFAPVIKKVAPSVVSIYSSLTIRDRGSANPFTDDPMLRRFFGENFGQEMAPRERHAQSLGSGVIISPDGYILTANHVVEKADKIRVALATGEKEYEARVVGTDPPTDVAVLKIEGKTLPAVTLADSDKLEVGDLVLALGNPFGVGQTVTMGIISAVGRGGFEINDYENFIQTDAAINPGNSGGALTDTDGRLIGINTAIFSQSGGNMGIGFAVPINMARFVMERIISEGKVTRGYLGINIQPLTPDLAKEFGLPDESSGVLVGGVAPGGAAEKAGLKDGDVILDFNGKKITDYRALQIFVAQTPPGTKVKLRVLHSDNGKKFSEKEVTVVLKELPQEEITSSNPRTPSSDRNHPGTDALDGVEVTDIDARTRRRLDMPNGVHGALVTNVEPNSNAASQGLRPGDVIVEIDRQPVRNADEAVALSEKAKGEHVLLRVWNSGRGGGTRFVLIASSRQKQ
jgi:serine protease Do